jgi:hypothetical protein
MICKTPHSGVNHLSTSLVVFFPILACILDCTCRDKPSWQGQSVCAWIDNQQICGIVIATVRSLCSEPSSSMLRSPSINLPLPLRRSGSNPSSCCIKFQVACEVLSWAFYLVFAFLPSNTKKPKKHLYFLLSYNL